VVHIFGFKNVRKFTKYSNQKPFKRKKAIKGIDGFFEIKKSKN